MGIYLDNAATSWPKPEVVYLAVEHFMREVGATPGRGGHRREEEAARIADEARMALAQLFNAPDPAGVAFTMNATQAINMALKGLLQPGDHVITTSIEHNAMWRPLKALERRGVALTAVPLRARRDTRPGGCRGCDPAQHAADRHAARLQRPGHDPADWRDRPDCS